jgi:hypothetical protein
MFNVWASESINFVCRVYLQKNQCVCIHPNMIA